MLSFFKGKVKNNKKSFRKNQKADIYIEEFNDIEIVDGDVLKVVREQLREIYKIQNVVSSGVEFGLVRNVNIVVDTDGRMILTNKDLFKATCVTGFINSDNLEVSKSKVEYCLTEEEVIKLAKWCLQIEKYFSKVRGTYSPMDIEWAKDGNTGELFIVQARPETVQSGKDKNVLKEYKLGT